MADNSNTESNTLTAVVSGGLNTVSSALTLPPEDSPNMMNTYVKFDGSVTKRPGTFRTATIGDPRERHAVPIKLRNGYDAIAEKAGTALQFKVAGRTLTKLDVFSDEAAYIRPDVVVSNEPNCTRILFFTGVNIPVQLSILEMNAQVNFTATDQFTIKLPAEGWATPATPTDAIIVWVDDVLYSVTNLFAYNAGTNEAVWQLAGGNISLGVHTVKILSVTWQWWAEGLRLRTEQINQQKTVGATQVHVGIPADLLSGIAELSAGFYPIRVYSSPNYDSLYTRATAFMPTTATQYTFSSGEENKDSAGTVRPHVPSPNFISFGASSGSSRTVLFHRGYKLPFHGGDGGLGSGLGASLMFSSQPVTWSSSQPPSESGAGTGGARYSYSVRDNSFLVQTSPLTRSPYITFDATSTANGGVAIPQDDVMMLVDGYANTHIGVHVGSGAKNTTAFARRYDDGYAWAVFGLSAFCDYKRASFPRTATLWGGRLVLAGFPYNPLAVAVSSIGDVNDPGNYFTDFQMDFNTGADYEAYETMLNGGADDTITCCREFQNQLFVWTRYKLFRIVPESRPLEVGMATVAQVGCVNSGSACIADRTLFFLSQNGVFAVIPTDDAAGYTVQEASIKIRNRMTEYRPNLEGTAWIMYDHVKSDLYVGLSDGNWVDRCNNLYVMNVLRNSWTEYTNASGCNFFTTGGYVQYPSSTQSWPSVIGWSDRDAVDSYVTTGGGYFLFEEQSTADWHMDFSGGVATYSTGNGTWKGVEFVTQANKLEYDPSLWSFYRQAFRPISVLDVEDVQVFLNGTKLTFGQDFFKTERGTIVLGILPNAGNVLRIESIIPGSKRYPVAMRVNGEVIDPDLYTVTVDTVKKRYLITPTTMPVFADYVETGTCFPCWHYSPTFTRGTILNTKRLTHFAGFYNNEAAGDAWREDEVGTRYDLVGVFKKKVNLDVIVLFDDTQSGQHDVEIFGSSVLTWDEAALELGVPSTAYRKYTRCVIPIVGNGYNVQVVHYLFGQETFQIAGYQLKAIVKRTRGLPRE